ncbi:MAG: Nramp family divalent metal transporter [Patescibacteria group bacterium]|jgi:NRAMP (natural resistance-associated macrophage protein)-like metal ion transporter
MPGTKIKKPSVTHHINPTAKIGKVWHTLGPGLTTGAADDDPSGIATYSQSGAKYGFSLLWLAPLTFPLMSVVQEMCARIGLVTGRGLAANIKHHYRPWVLFLCAGLLLIANTFNIGADLGAMAKATQLLLPSANFVLLIISYALISILLQVLVSYRRYSKYLKWLALVLLAYVLTAFTIKMDWLDVIRHTLIPTLTLTKDQILLITGILGTTISPYLFFWQTSQEVEEEIMVGRSSVQSRTGATNKEIKDMRFDVWTGMLFSNLVMLFIIAVCAATLNASGISNIATAADAAAALRPLAGNGASWLFALGIIGTGLLAVPVLAGSAAYAITESFGWHEGLYRKFKKAHAFYGVIACAVVVGGLINFIHLDPIKALIYSAVLNALVAPVVLILIIRLSSNRQIMGVRTNSRPVKIVGWAAFVLMLLAGLATIVSSIN